jgi:endonuclease-8
MPEGPSIIILRELVSDFPGKIITQVEGNSIDQSRLVGLRIEAIQSWGKHFILVFCGFSLRIHFLMFGSYAINERKASASRLGIRCADGSEMNFYACSIKFLEGELTEHYDWRIDVMSEQWDAALARKKLRSMPEKYVCDAVLDQEVFAGAGNIFKNEVLFRIRVHPLSTLGALPPKKLRDLVTQVRVYGGEFLAWKKTYVLKKHWLAHNKRMCPRCDIPFSRAHLGKTHRRSFFCERCQKKYVPIL